MVANKRYYDYCCKIFKTKLYKKGMPKRTVELTFEIFKLYKNVLYLLSRDTKYVIINS